MKCFKWIGSTTNDWKNILEPVWPWILQIPFTYDVFFFCGADFLKSSADGYPFSFELRFVFFFGGTVGYIHINSKQRVNAFQYDASCQRAVLLVCLPVGLTMQTHASIPTQFPLQSSHINSNLISPNKKSEVPLHNFPLQKLPPS